MMNTPIIHERPEASIPAGVAPAFPVDLGDWTDSAELLDLAYASAARSGGESWLHLLGDLSGLGGPVDDVLVLLTYCYLRGTYHSIDVLRRLDTDPRLTGLRARCALRTEQIRRFRRDRRREITDCLTRAFVDLWLRRVSAHGAHPRTAPKDASGRPDFRFLEPFYLQAQDRVDRAVVFDSMAQDE